MPEFNKILSGFSIRAPIKNVTMLDINLFLKNDVTITKINSLFKKQSKAQELFGIDDENRVSSDYVSDLHAVVVDCKLTEVFNDGKNLKVIAWFDNEYGYSNTIVNLIKRIGFEVN